MHDPDVVAFEIRRPWPRRDSFTPPNGPRWSFRGCFWQLAGRRYYWPSLVTVWHHEPGGHDSGEVCKHYVRTQGPDGKWSSRILHGWRWHVWHWSLQIHSLQRLRRALLSRCAGCGGRSTRAHRLNTGGSWYPPKRHWWQGEADLWHGDCHSRHVAAVREARP